MMKCEKCGYTDNGIGDSAHVCSPNPTIKSTFDGDIGKLLAEAEKRGYDKAVKETKRIRYCRPEFGEYGFGASFSYMADEVRKSELYKIGDTVLIWVNEGDLMWIGDKI